MSVQSPNQSLILLLRQVDERQARLNQLKPWPGRAAERLWAGLLPDWIAGSNAIDGSRLTRDETEQLLAESGLFVDHSLREHLDVLNQRQAIEEIRRLAAGKNPLRAATARKIHALLIAGIDDQSAGVYRKRLLEGESRGVAEQMREWEMWVAGPACALHPIERSAVAHHQLLRIQPFSDANGKVARLIMNLSLLHDGYLPAILRYEDRHDYRQALHFANQKVYAPLVELVARSVDRIQRLYLLVLES